MPGFVYQIQSVNKYLSINICWRLPCATYCLRSQDTTVSTAKIPDPMCLHSKREDGQQQALCQVSNMVGRKAAGAKEKIKQRSRVDSIAELERGGEWVAT